SGRGGAGGANYAEVQASVPGGTARRRRRHEYAAGSDARKDDPYLRQSGIRFANIRHRVAPIVLPSRPDEQKSWSVPRPLRGEVCTRVMRQGMFEPQPDREQVESSAETGEIW